MNSFFKNCSIRCCGSAAADYHAEQELRGSAKFTVTQHNLVEFSRCPRRWKLGYAAPTTEAKEWGSMVDCLLLTPDEWAKRYSVLPTDAPRRPSIAQRNAKKPSSETIAAIKWWDDWAANNPGQIVDAETCEAAKASVARLVEDEQIRDLLVYSRRQVWIAGEYHDAATKLVLPVKALVDIAPNAEHPVFGGCLADFKTTRAGHPDLWKRWVFDRRYHVQAAFYLDLWNAATGESRNTWLHVIQENFPPYEPGKRILSSRFVQAGRFLYSRMLAFYAHCVATGNWPGYDLEAGPMDGWSITEPDAWMEDESMKGYGKVSDSDLDEMFAAPKEVAA